MHGSLTDLGRVEMSPTWNSTFIYVFLSPLMCSPLLQITLIHGGYLQHVVGTWVSEPVLIQQRSCVTFPLRISLLSSLLDNRVVILELNESLLCSDSLPFFLFSTVAVRDDGHCTSCFWTYWSRTALLSSDLPLNIFQKNSYKLWNWAVGAQCWFHCIMPVPLCSINGHYLWWSLVS